MLFSAGYSFCSRNSPPEPRFPATNPGERDLLRASGGKDDMNMKKKALSLLLASLLVFALSLPALAGNGPQEIPADDWYPAALLLERTDSEHMFQQIPLFLSNTVKPMEGAVYDKATNTLTLTDFGGYYELICDRMGDDFTLRVEGDCALDQIDCRSKEWGNGLHITGSGTLTLNPRKNAQAGIIFHGERGAATPLRVDASVTLNIYGTAAAIQVFQAESFSATADGAPIAFDRTAHIFIGSAIASGYTDISSMELPLCRCEADPEGIYAIYEDYDYKGVFTGMSVCRYIYLEKYDMYFKDYAWTHGEHDGDRKFPTAEDAAKAGFTAVLDGNGKQVWLPVTGPKKHIFRNLYEDAEGNRYVLSYDIDNVALRFEPIEGLDGEFLFTPVPEVDVESLEEVFEERPLEGLYDFSYPGKEYVHTAGSGDPTPSVMLGDVDGDKSITAADARLALRRAVELETYAPGSREYIACDVDKEGGVTAADARLILRAAVELEDPTKW